MFERDGKELFIIITQLLAFILCNYYRKKVI